MSLVSCGLQFLYQWRSKLSANASSLELRLIIARPAISNALLHFDNPFSLEELLYYVRDFTEE
jgi:hypothetical protein